MSKKIDLTGQRFGRLRVIRDSRERTECGHIIWLCRCSCGKRVKVISGNLRYGHTRSCGCLSRERIATLGRANLRHGENDKNSRLYIAWINMKRKCYNPNAINFKNYGGRKIRVCREWLGKTGYISFRAWMLNHGYSPGLRYYLISRKDCGKNFSPDNCQIISRVGWLEL